MRVVLVWLWLAACGSNQAAAPPEAEEVAEPEQGEAEVATSMTAGAGAVEEEPGDDAVVEERGTEGAADDGSAESSDPVDDPAPGTGEETAPDPEPAVDETTRAQGSGPIRQISPVVSAITRAHFEELVAANTARPSFRAVPRVRDGMFEGVRLSGIRRRSPMYQLGLRNGDLVRQVAGRDIGSPQYALEAYAAARNADRFTVALTRRGQPVVLEIRVVESFPE